MKQLKDRRVINIPKDDYIFLKEYCDKNTLDMPKWIVKNSKEKIPITKDNSDNFTLDEILKQIENDPDNFFVDISQLVDDYCEFKNKKSVKIKIEFLKKLAKILNISPECIGALDSYKA